ncbi:hypothetical protein SEA_RYADEL_67 [Mycobacterium phage Ryadel]|uniref:Minor tail protein gp31 C-terminal domain-containing protein n=2 Tax=Corndogvirus TaxID=1623285 RepID=A0A345MF36_9CAUD|nr:hypothetical protein PBI_CATDAWG_63 [Mycobacterium phage Catdawg]YP_010097557.1 hypothetical protein KNU03_gp067 [Mycobacterium phage Ryadel]ATW60546.1 hypothetical protein SEA_FAMILTON_64 [Mycobacterium phage Familton]AVI04094.1 hypothetical protein SEA_JANGDYNASTY_63 [Mycobacterium phage JangDynasty]AYQ98900.1 hypothetical protein SEA_VORRPS_63 [Mycobacterium phage Vorrps]QGJ87385.1 hypothetical protein SEA_BLESSICA_64 [Mycobacterium phage Blessica]QOC58495.1 hypothetical protein SEA_SHI
MALPTNWVDEIGMEVDAAYLNDVGETVNELDDALDGKSLRVMSQATYDGLGSKDSNTVYVVT